MNYLVIDLEMCKVPKEYRTKYRYATEIIEIGAVLLDEEFQVIATQKQYVKPQYGVIDRFIMDLTGIKNGQVKHAPKLGQAIAYLLDWIGNREYQILAWSENDRNQLMRELQKKMESTEQISAFMAPERWINYQATFSQRFQFTRPVGLEEALLLCEIEPDGRQHDGLDDAINTAKLIEKLENHPEYQLMEEAKSSCDLEKEPLNFSLGSLFANLDLHIA